jgi:hypothetical protein
MCIKRTCTACVHAVGYVGAALAAINPVSTTSEETAATAHHDPSVSSEPATAAKATAGVGQAILWGVGKSVTKAVSVAEIVKDKIPARGSIVFFSRFSAFYLLGFLGSCSVAPLSRTLSFVVPFHSGSSRCDLSKRSVVILQAFHVTQSFWHVRNCLVWYKIAMG